MQVLRYLEDLEAPACAALHVPELIAKPKQPLHGKELLVSSISKTNFTLHWSHTCLTSQLATEASS